MSEQERRKTQDDDLLDMLTEGGDIATNILVNAIKRLKASETELKSSLQRELEDTRVETQSLRSHITGLTIGLAALTLFLLIAVGFVVFQFAFPQSLLQTQFDALKVQNRELRETLVAMASRTAPPVPTTPAPVTPSPVPTLTETATLPRKTHTPTHMPVPETPTLVTPTATKSPTPTVTPTPNPLSFWIKDPKGPGVPVKAGSPFLISFHVCINPDKEPGGVRFSQILIVISHEPKPREFIVATDVHIPADKPTYYQQFEINAPQQPERQLRLPEGVYSVQIRYAIVRGPDSVDSQNFKDEKGTDVNIAIEILK